MCIYFHCTHAHTYTVRLIRTFAVLVVIVILSSSSEHVVGVEVVDRTCSIRK